MNYRWTAETACLPVDARMLEWRTNGPGVANSVFGYNFESDKRNWGVYWKLGGIQRNGLPLDDWDSLV